MAFEAACDEAAVKGDVAFLKNAVADTFIMTHGDGWMTGGSPIKVDTKATWLAYVAQKPAPYDYRRLDSVKVEPHGDIAITIGRYRYHPAIRATRTRRIRRRTCMSGSSVSTPSAMGSGSSCRTGP